MDEDVIMDYTKTLKEEIPEEVANLIAEKEKQYRQDNKEKIAKRKKEYYKNKILC